MQILAGDTKVHHTRGSQHAKPFVDVFSARLLKQLDAKLMGWMPDLPASGQRCTLDPRLAPLTFKMQGEHAVEIPVFAALRCATLSASKDAGLGKRAWNKLVERVLRAALDRPGMETISPSRAFYTRREDPVNRRVRRGSAVRWGTFRESCRPIGTS
ncbi:hypothetical protein BV25DRAFT_776870 [Artomyces pyxidatus]|uniref:Uncharacterized protein n=1 Tax=Artomyces pyxidatus TaxID=48021 RepID=A0ACB8SXL5_9AGAM|nr:hypothetical protein BV25DRAFT_776870 [Artomyces pyxidatus]